MNVLNKIEKLAPQWFLALVVIVAAVLIIIYNKPPHSLCSTQKSAFIKSQQKFLASKYYDMFFKNCLATNSRGGCEPYFSGFKKVMDDFKLVDNKCKKEVASASRIKSALQSFLIQVPRLAWGDQGPDEIYDRNAWLSPGHLRTYCRVRNHYQRYYGKGSYQALEKGVLKILPNEKKLSEIQKKERSLFSTPCYQYN